MFQGLQSVAIVLAVVGTGGLTELPQSDAPVQPLTTQAFAASCQQTLAQSDHDFSTGVSAADGCGCFASTLAQNPNADLAATSLLLREVIASDSTQEPDWSAIATTVGVDDMKLGQMLQMTNSAIGMCMQA